MLIKSLVIFTLIFALTGFAEAETVNISFESSDNPAAIRGVEGTNIYVAQGVNFPSRPTIKILPLHSGSVLQQGSVSGGPDPLPTRIVCGSLEMQFSPEMNVRAVRFMALNRKLSSYWAKAYHEVAKVDEFFFRSPRHIIPGSINLTGTDIQLRSPSDSGGITRVVLSAPGADSHGDCFDLAVIDNLSFDTANPVIGIAPVPPPPRPEPPPPLVSLYSASDANPMVRFSGRVNDIAVNPHDSRSVLVTTETGGLWRSYDAGSTWQPVPSLPVFKLNAVHYVKSNPNIILVTAEQDFKKIPLGDGTIVTSGGGVWISRNGGRSWSHPAQSVPSFAGRTPPLSDAQCPAISDAFGISEDEDSGRIFIATSCGISFVDNITNPGATTWSHHFFHLTNNGYRTRKFATVSALQGPGVIAGGGDGAWYSDNNGVNWSRSTTPVGTSVDIHGSTPVADVDGTALLITGVGVVRNLWLTRNSGETWTSVPLGAGQNPPPDSHCGGIAHIYVGGSALRPRPRRNRQIYYGNTCQSYRGRLRIGRRSVANLWQRIIGSHGDTRAMAFVASPGTASPAPHYLGSDGGLDIRSPSGVWEPVGSGPNGINALQVYGVKGQTVLDTGAYRLAFGTQDNSLWAWASDDEVSRMAGVRQGNEGDAITMSSVTSSRDSDQWTFYNPGGSAFAFRSDPLFRSPSPWAGYTSRPSWTFSSPEKISDMRPGWYVQLLGDNTSMGRSPKIAYTTDYGRTFTDIDIPTDSFYSHQKVAGGMIFQAYFNRPDSYPEIVQEQPKNLLKIKLRRYQIEPINRFDPAMNGFGSLGTYAFQFQWWTVFGVDPDNPDHIIAPDAQNRQIMVSEDAGDNWTKIPGLAEQITHMGIYDMAMPIVDSDRAQSLVSAVSFNPVNPDLVLIGLQMGGAYISEDGGQKWLHVVNSDRIPNIIDFDWKSIDEIYVDSYGRGLWKIKNTFRRIPLRALISFLTNPHDDTPILRNIILSGDLKVSLDRGTNSFRNFLSQKRRNPVLMSLEKALRLKKFDQVALVVDGYITGLKNSASLESSVELTPGAMAYYFGKKKKIQHLGSAKNGITLTKGLNVSKVLTMKHSNLIPKKSQKKNSNNSYPELSNVFNKITVPTTNKSRLYLNTLPKQSVTGGGQKDIGVVGIAIKNGKFAGSIIGHKLRHKPSVSGSKIVARTSSGKNTHVVNRPTVRFYPNTKGIFLADGRYDANNDLVVEGSNFDKNTKQQIKIDGQLIYEVSSNPNGHFVDKIPLKKLRLSAGVHVFQISNEKGKVLLTETIVIHHLGREENR